MKRTLPLIAAIAIIFFISIQAKELGVTDLSGPYGIIGFTKSDEMTFKKIKEKGYLNFGEKPFDFLDDKTLKVNSNMSEFYFKETLFKYQITNNQLKLKSTKSDLKHDLYYDTEGGVFNLHIDHPAITRFQLIKWNLNGKRE